MGIDFKSWHPGNWGKKKRGFDWNRYSLDNLYGNKQTPNYSSDFQRRDYDTSSIQGVGDKLRFDEELGSVETDLDFDSINERTTNPYLDSTAQTSDALRDFWGMQTDLSRQAEQRLSDIDSFRSSYRDLIDSLNTRSSTYTQEQDRVRDVGRELESDYASASGSTEGYNAEVSRIRAFLENEFKSDWDTFNRGRDKYWHERDQRGVQKRMKNMEKTEREWETAFASKQSDQKRYQDTIDSLLQERESNKAYLKELTPIHQDYKSYSSRLQNEQSNLSDYLSQIRGESAQLEDYATQFNAARQRSEDAARSYTVKSQQGIANKERGSVSGIRSNKGYDVGSRTKNRSTKRRFNRDFRIEGLSDTGIPQINV